MRLFIPCRPRASVGQSSRLNRRARRRAAAAGISEENRADCDSETQVFHSGEVVLARRGFTLPADLTGLNVRLETLLTHQMDFGLGNIDPLLVSVSP